MPDKVITAFNLRRIHIPVGRVLPTKQVITDEKKNRTFRRVLVSIREIGVIEPVIVFPQSNGKSPYYSILDGHVRFEAMKKLGYEAIPCLISTEDEGYTYNHKVNIVPPIHEHFMIMKAIENGVSEEKIATALDVDIASIRHKRDLLNGVCAEAVELLKDKHTCRDALSLFRRVKPMRQIEMAELMVKSNNFTASYAKCLLAATPEDELLEPHKPKAPKGLKPDEVTGMEKEMASLDQNFAALEDAHGKNVLHLVLATGFLRKLLENGPVTRFLNRHYGGIATEFQKLIVNSSLDGAG